jgi:beta-lactam-binding protein with PASTA domain
VTSATARAPRRTGQDWYFALALALFVGVAVWFSRQIQDFLTPSNRNVATPTLVGQTLADALATADRTHMKAIVVQRTPSDRFPKDIVIRQEPAPGASVREGRQISLVVSNGVQIFAMPDLRYESRRELGLDLSHLKLQLGKVRIVTSDDVPADAVVSQDPAPLVSVRAGTIVNVDLSKGGPTSVRVPNFINESIDDVRQQAEDAHIHFGQIVWTPFGRFGPARGVIVRQNPAPNAAIDAADTVSLQVSAGPLQSGYLIHQVHAAVTIPEDTAVEPGQSPTVRVQVRDETGTWNVYSAFAEPKQRLDFNLTTVGTSELDVFVNNELIDSTKLGVEPPLQEKQVLGPRPPHVSPPPYLLPKGFPR